MPAPPHGPRRKVLAVLVAVVAGLYLYPRPARGTIAEDRARLPPPETCDDPVEGIWVSKTFVERRSQWYDFTLAIHRTSPGAAELTGEITSHFWDGDKTAETPPSCGRGALEAVVKMPASGAIERGDDGDHVRFGGTSYSIESVRCGGMPSYYPDKFSGVIDKSIQEFQSVNNDGGALINVRHVFRRVRCFDAPPAPVVPPAPEPSPPPPPAPARSSRGCGCGLF